jgi:hypothetical protein
MTNTYQPRVQPRPFPYRGRSKSADLRALFDSLIADVRGISGVANGTAQDQADTKATLFNEILALKSASKGLKLLQKQLVIAQVAGGLPYVYANTMMDTDDVERDPSSPPEKRCNIDTVFNVVTPPRNNAISMFYDIPADNPGTVLPKETNITVEGLEEYSGDVTPGIPSNALSGNDYDIWIRKVSLPLYSDVTKTKCRITIDVPTAAASANLISLVPYPFGSVNIEQVDYATDIGEDWRTIARLAPEFGDTSSGVIQFVPIRNAGPTQIYFTPTNIRRLRITFSQDNWVEEDGRKTFYYGFQEIGLWRVAYEEASDPADPYNILKNNTMMFSIDAPAGYVMTRLAFFDWEPDADVLWQVSSNMYDFGPGYVIWSSDQGKPQAPGAPSFPIDSMATVYAKCVLGVSSPGLPLKVRAFQAHFDTEPR